MDTPSKSSGEENHRDLQTQTQTRPKRFRKTSSSNYDYMECLPGDVIFEILVRVPAQDVHNSARLVCRKWHNIIRTRDFKHAHLHRSTFGFLVGDVSNIRGQQPLFMTFIATGSKAGDDDLSVEICKLSDPSQLLVLSSCNGLVLAARKKYPYFYITNPITKQKLDLPPFSTKNILHYASAIAYVATTMEYKVVRPCVRRGYKLESQDDCVDILTLGVDKDWTCRVNTQHLSLQAKKLLASAFPFTTQGFVHWARGERKYEHVLTLNVSTEVFTQFPVPCLRRKDGFSKGIYLPMGSYLSLLVLRSEFSWELWEMKPETGEWTQMPSIDLLEDQLVRSRKYVLEPVGWLRPREVLVFSATNSSVISLFEPQLCFAFTVRTSKLQGFTLDGRSGIHGTLLSSLDVQVNDISCHMHGIGR